VDAAPVEVCSPSAGPIPIAPFYRVDVSGAQLLADSPRVRHVTACRESAGFF